MAFKSDKISIDCYPISRDEVEHYSWMFKEDFRKNITRGLAKGKDSIEYSLVPFDQEFQNKILAVLPVERDYYKNEIEDIITENVQFIADQLVYKGYVVLELVIEEGDGKTYKLSPIYGQEVKIENSYVVQVIDQTFMKKYDIAESKIKIPIEKCFVIEFPTVLGGKDGYLKFIKRLKDFGRININIYNNSLMKVPGYNINEHLKRYELELWNYTNVYNWHHRRSYSELFSGYYHFARTLKFRKSQIILRDHIVTEVKAIIRKTSIILGREIDLKIYGMLNLIEIDEALEKWENGTLETDSIGRLL